MNVGRLCSVQGSTEATSHGRLAEYLKVQCERYPGMEFAPRVEWIGEQAVEALRLLLADTRCTEEERRAVARFLALASEELPGPA